MALDGYVNGPPAYAAWGPHANFDHHQGVDRIGTRSTCFQVFLAINMGLFDTFQRKGVPHAHVYVNDVDQDVCLAYWLLTHPERLERLQAWQPLSQLIVTEDLLDATAGAYPIDPEEPMLRQQAWVFEPYTDARSDGSLVHMAAEDMVSVVDRVCRRISRFLSGEGRAVDLDTRYEDLGGGPGWRLIREVGMYARTRLFAEGILAFVACRENGDGTYTYSIGKMSPFVTFPVLRIFRRLNEADGITDPNDAWGGTGIIGGSPRRSRSRLPPAEVEGIVNDCLRGK